MTHEQDDPPHKVNTEAQLSLWEANRTCARKLATATTA